MDLLFQLLILCSVSIQIQIVIGKTLVTKIAGTSKVVIEQGAITTTKASSNDQLVFNNQEDFCQVYAKGECPKILSLETRSLTNTCVNILKQMQSYMGLDNPDAAEDEEFVDHDLDGDDDDEVMDDEIDEDGFLRNPIDEQIVNNLGN
ncbi:hypothetical protein C1645_787883 [Glomus cerebriforme]|uniref:Uncharacterized protein n=1 Tax=Glomus cerebriforme TaxID=658196 RepID=A0A397SF87_9GLOM|nr:hypothetical protein C1645_787883 [Glomus cerebriforme]